MKMIKHNSRLKEKPALQLCRPHYSRHILDRVILALIILSCLSSMFTSAQTTDKIIGNKGTTSTGLTKLYDFNPSSDGDFALISDIAVISPWLFTLQQSGGTMDNGSIIKIKTDASEGIRWWMWDASCSDIEASGSFLYGTKRAKGSDDNGLIFRTNVDGTGWKTIFNFSKVYQWPSYSMTIVDSVIYGNARELGAEEYLFSVRTDGSEFLRIDIETGRINPE